MSRRVRRDSETSTDSWSLVEEDRLDDDFSLNSTDNEEAELDTVPIIEEPPSSGEEEEEDTASEKSLDSDSEDSDDSELSDEESELSDASDDEEAEAGEVILEESSDSDLSDAESEDSELSEQAPVNSDDESELSESELSDEELNEEEIAEAARQLKEDEQWIDDRLDENEGDKKWIDEELEAEGEENHRSIRAILVFSLFLMLFPLADIFTSWMLTYRNHRFVSSREDYVKFIFEDNSQQSHIDEQMQSVVKIWEQRAKMSKEEKERRWIQKMQEESTTYSSPPNSNNLHLLKDILEQKPRMPQIREYEFIELFNVSPFSWKRMSEIEYPSNRTTKRPWSGVSERFIRKIRSEPTSHYQTGNITWWPRSSRKSDSYRRPAPICRALAPIPPAPFTPRRVPRRQLPRHQPCFVHVNQSKWTCQKNLPSVIYQESTTPLMPRVYKKKAMGRTGDRQKKVEENKWIAKTQVCPKKASQSMRNMPKPTDQCSKFVQDVTVACPRERRHHIAYKTPLPCKMPTYKPTVPKKSYKPSNTEDDWHHKRSQYRAQLRSRA